MRQIFLWLYRRTGKTGQISDSLPSSLLLRFLFQRLFLIFFGLLLERTLVFRHPSASTYGQRSFGRYAFIGKDCTINGHSIDGVSVGARTRIGAYSILSASNHLSFLGKGISIGDDCSVGEFSFIGGGGGVSIGDKVIMGQFVSFHPSNHVFSGMIPIIDQGVTRSGIVIESDVWVGSKATFLDGCVVRKHSVVAAGSVVMGEFPPNSLIAGVPARLVRSLEGEKDLSQDQVS